MSSMIISTGGTGGHVIPAKVFYDYFKEKFNVKIISDKRGLNFIEKENYNVNEIHIPQFKKNFSILIFPFFLIASFLKSLFICFLQMYLFSIKILCNWSVFFLSLAFISCR